MSKSTLKRPATVVGVGMACIPGAALRAQCIGVWSALPGPALNHQVFVLRTWDPDGIGPQKPVLLAGGNFSHIGPTQVNYVAQWDGSSWSSLSAGVSSSVRAIGLFGPTSSSAVPVVGGWFSAASGVPASRIARWDGAAWNALGSGVSGLQFPHVDAVLQYGPDLMVGGWFTMAGGNPANFIAAWDGAAWRAIPDRAAAAEVFYIFEGELYAGGHFVDPGAPYPYTSVLRYTGQGWANVGIDPPRDTVVAFATYQGRLIAGGYFDGAPFRYGNIAMLEGDTWVSLGLGLSAPVLALATFDPDGSGPGPELLIAGGDFTLAGGQTAYGIAAWDGLQWMPVGGGVNATVRALAVYEDKLVAGGHFSYAGEVPAAFIARWGCPAPAPCYANCDQSTVLPLLNVADFSCFLQRFAAGDPYANCDGSTAVPALNILDFACFLQKFAGGCG